MNKKLLLIVLLAVALTVTLTACDSHQHTYDDKWSYDENYHWHKSTCEHTDETTEKEAHDIKVVPGNNGREECTVCGYVKKQSDPTPQPKPHEHTYATTLSSNENGHWYELTCEHTDQITVVPHSYADGVCSACGWWSSASEVLFANLSKFDVWDYCVTFYDVQINDVNLLSEGLEHAAMTVSGELKLVLSSDGGISGCGYVETDGASLKAVIDDGMVYACGDGKFIRCALDELLAQNGIDVNAYIDRLNADTQQIRGYVDQIKQITQELPIEEIVANELWTTLVKRDDANSTETLTAYVVDYDVLRQLNRILSTTTVRQYVDASLAELSGTALGSLLGDNTAGLPNKVRSLLKSTIGATLLKLEFDNHSLDELLGEINALISKYYPDDSVNTIDQLLPVLGLDLDELFQAVGFNVKGLTVKEAVVLASGLSPETLWNLVQQDNSTKISADEISAKLTELISLYGDKTVYQIAVADNTSVTDVDLKAYIDGFADMLEESVTVTFYVDTNGVLQQASVTSFEQIVSLSLNGELKQDYSQVIEQVNAYYDSLEASAAA